jgi:hypothetical protein
MHPVDAAVEAWRNLLSGTARALWLVLALTAAGGVLIWLDLGAVVNLVRGAHAYAEAGAATLVLQTAGRVDGAACQRLGSLDGAAAGAITVQHHAVRPAQLPQQDIEVAIATPGLARILGIAPRTAGVWVSREAADALAVQVGSALVLDGRFTTVAAVYDYPDDGRRVGLGYAVIEPVPADGAFDECWLERWPLSAGTRGLLNSVATRAGTDDDTRTIAQLNPTLGIGFDVEALYGRRPTASAWLLAAGLGAVVGAVFFRLRRLEFASARHAGVGLGAVEFTSTIEVLACLLATWAILAPLVVLLVRGVAVADAAGCWALAARILVMLSLGAVLGAAAAVAGARERHLFDYFKAR